MVKKKRPKTKYLEKEQFAKIIYTFTITYLSLFGINALLVQRHIISFIFLSLAFIMMVLALGYWWTRPKNSKAIIKTVDEVAKAQIFVFNSMQISLHGAFENLSEKFETIIKRLEVSTKRANISKRERIRIFKKTTYIFIFFFLPVTFLLMVVNGNGQYQNEVKIIVSNINESQIEGHYSERVEGTLFNNEQTNVAVKMSYLFGDIFEIPIYDVCFENMESNYSSSQELFSSQLLFNNDSYELKYLNKTCVQTNVKQSDFKLSTKNSFVLSKKINIEDILPEERVTHISFKLNSNFWFMVIIILIVWIGSCHLIYHVFIDLKHLGGGNTK